MSAIKWVIGGFLGLWLFDKVRSAAAAGTLNFRIGGIRLDGGAVVIDLIVQNPSPASFYINSLSGNVYLGDSAVGNISMFETIFISGTSESTLPVLLRLNIFGALDLIRNFIDKKLQGVSLKIAGNVNVNNVLFPLNIQFR